MSRLELRRGVRQEMSVQDHFRATHARRQAQKAALAAAEMGEPTVAAELRAIDLLVRAHLNSGPKVRALIEALRGWAEAEDIDPALLRRLRLRLDDLDRDNEDGGEAGAA